MSQQQTVYSLGCDKYTTVLYLDFCVYNAILFSKEYQLLIMLFAADSCFVLFSLLCCVCLLSTIANIAAVFVWRNYCRIFMPQLTLFATPVSKYGFSDTAPRSQHTPRIGQALPRLCCRGVENPVMLSCTLNGPVLDEIRGILVNKRMLWCCARYPT